MADNNNIISMDIRPRVATAIESMSNNGVEGPQNARFFIGYLDPPLNEPEMVAIADALSHCSHVEKVNLNWNLNIRSPARATSTFLNNILETHPSIKKISLQYCCIDNILAGVIGIALKTNTSLKELDLYNNIVGASGAEALADGLSDNKTLRVLDLSFNQVRNRGAIALAEVLRSNKTLETLGCAINEVTEVGAKALASALGKSSLKVLNLASNQIKDKGGKAIAYSVGKNKSLTRLVLRGTGIGDETCKALAAGLYENSSLTKLDLSWNRGITNVGATALEETLKHMNYTVEELRLGHDATHNLCAQNRRVKAFFERVNENIPAISLGVWPSVLEAVECKPDLLYALLKTKPELCGEALAQIPSSTQKANACSFLQQPWLATAVAFILLAYYYR